MVTGVRSLLEKTPHSRSVWTPPHHIGLGQWGRYFVSLSEENVREGPGRPTGQRPTSTTRHHTTNGPPATTDLHSLLEEVGTEEGRRTGEGRTPPPGPGPSLPHLGGRRTPRPQAPTVTRFRDTSCVQRLDSTFFLSPGVQAPRGSPERVAPTLTRRRIRVGVEGPSPRRSGPLALPIVPPPTSPPVPLVRRARSGWERGRSRSRVCHGSGPELHGEYF